jgi:broad specificity phosphatase PhoE
LKTMICIRHGRTAWNAAGRFLGHADIPLDATGREQVRATALRLREVACHHAVSSDLGRARETLALLLEGRGVAPLKDAGFRERDFGAWEGLTWDEITELEPALKGSGILEIRGFQPRGGELFSVVKGRVFAAYERALARIEPGQTVFAVAHAGVFHALLDQLFGADRNTALIPPAGAFALLVTPGEVTFEGIIGL